MFEKQKITPRYLNASRDPQFEKRRALYGIRRHGFQSKQNRSFESRNASQTLKFFNLISRRPGTDIHSRRFRPGATRVIPFSADDGRFTVGRHSAYTLPYTSICYSVYIIYLLYLYAYVVNRCKILCGRVIPRGVQ